MTRVDRLPSSVAPYDYHQRRQPPAIHQPLSTVTASEPPHPTADHSTRSHGTPFSLLSPPFSFSGIWSSRRDSRFKRKTVRNAHHLSEPSLQLATVAGEHHERKDGRLDDRSKISKKSIQMSIVALSRLVSAWLPFFRVKRLRPVNKISHKNFRNAGKTKATNSRLASVNSRDKQISILRRLPTSL